MSVCIGSCRQHLARAARATSLTKAAPRRTTTHPELTSCKTASDATTRSSPAAQRRCNGMRAAMVSRPSSLPLDLLKVGVSYGVSLSYVGASLCMLQRSATSPLCERCSDPPAGHLPRRTQASCVPVYR
jgi:hypothetical protein